MCGIGLELLFVVELDCCCVEEIVFDDLLCEYGVFVWFVYLFGIENERIELFFCFFVIYDSVG